MFELFVVDFSVVTVVVVSMLELFVVDVSVVTVVVVSMFELFVVDFSVVTVVVESMLGLCVVDFSETGVCGELCVQQMFLSFRLSVLLSSEHHTQFAKLVNGHCCYLQYCHALNISESSVFMFYIFKFAKSNNLFLLLFRMLIM
jgi:hypothetical protein